MLSINIQTKDPTIISLIVLVSSFLFFILVFYLFQPKFVQVIDQDGKTYRSKELIISFSSVFAFLAAIISLITASDKYGTREGNNIDKSLSFQFSNANTGFSL